jgi:hypothetical protein
MQGQCAGIGRGRETLNRMWAASTSLSAIYPHLNQIERQLYIWDNFAPLFTPTHFLLMDTQGNEYEAERQRRIEANRAKMHSLGLAEASRALASTVQTSTGVTMERMEEWKPPTKRKAPKKKASVTTLITTGRLCVIAAACSPTRHLPNSLSEKGTEGRLMCCMRACLSMPLQRSGGDASAASASPAQPTRLSKRLRGFSAPTLEAAASSARAEMERMEGEPGALGLTTKGTARRALATGDACQYAAPFSLWSIGVLAAGWAPAAVGGPTTVGPFQPCSAAIYAVD